MFRKHHAETIEALEAKIDYITSVVDLLLQRSDMAVFHDPYRSLPIDYERRIIQIGDLDSYLYQASTDQ